MSRLQDVLNKIQEVCQYHGLQYRLEQIMGEDDGTRIRVAYVKPENIMQYRVDLLGMPSKRRRGDPVEAEALVTISREGVIFEITKDDGTGVLDAIEAELEAFYSFGSDDDLQKIGEEGTPRRTISEVADLQKAHQVILDEIWAEAVRMWNQNSSSKDIARHIGWENPRSVTNRLRKLRQEYGEDVVLTNDERKQRARDGR